MKRIFTLALCAGLLLLPGALLPRVGDGVRPLNILVVDDGFRSGYAGKYISFLEDRTGKLTYEDVSRAEAAGRFVRADHEILNFGFSDSAFWVRFGIELARGSGTAGRELILGLEYPLLNHVEIYVVDGAGVKKKVSGNRYPHSAQEIPHRYILHRLKLKAGQPATVYLRIKTEGAVNIPVKLWDQLAFIEEMKHEQYFFGIYYGILLVMALFNLFLAVALRSLTYLYYVAYVVFQALFQLSLNGFGAEYLWPEFTALGMVSVSFFGSLLALFMNLFSRRFLMTRDNVPVLDRMIIGVLALFLGSFILSFTGPYSIAVQLLSAATIVGSILLLVIAVKCFLGGYRAARLYMLSWLFILIGLIILPVKNFGLLPHNLLTNYSIQIGSAFEVILMALALADRFRIMQREKEDVQREALERQRRMTESFARFVPMEFLKFLKRDSIVDVQLGDQVVQRMAVLFSDIRSFTAMSEKMTPQENIDFINSYLVQVSPVIRDHGGFIDKFIGDAIMALFPERPDDAVAAALDMRIALGEFNERRAAGGRDPISIGIGIHYGELMLGTVGEEGRIETTVIADAVNIASRLEGLTKKVGADIVVSRDVCDNLREPGRFAIERIGRVTVKGKQKPVEIFRLAGAK
jgi:adenylate cyclase